MFKLGISFGFGIRRATRNDWVYCLWEPKDTVRIDKGLGLPRGSKVLSIKIYCWWWWNFIKVSMYLARSYWGTLHYKIVNWIPYNYFKIYIVKKAYIWLFTIVENYYCGVFTDLTNYNRLQYHNSISRVEHVYSISTSNTHAPDIKQGVRRVQLHSDKHNIAFVLNAVRESLEIRTINCDVLVLILVCHFLAAVLPGLGVILKWREIVVTEACRII